MEPITERSDRIGPVRAEQSGLTALSVLIALTIALPLMAILWLALSGGILAIATALNSTIVFSMSPSVVILAVVFSSGVGLIFGLYPANKAAKKGAGVLCLANPHDRAAVLAEFGN